MFKVLNVDDKPEVGVDLVDLSHSAELLQQFWESVRELHWAQKHPAAVLSRANDLLHVRTVVCVVAVLLEENLPFIQIHVLFFWLQPFVLTKNLTGVEAVIFVLAQGLRVEADCLGLFEGCIALELAIDLLGQGHIESFRL